MSRLIEDLEAAIDRMGSWELYAEIAGMFAETLPETEAAITKAIEARTWPEARRLVHSLKSNCAAIGAEELRGRVYALEKACDEENGALVAELFPRLRADLRALREELFALV